jgi:hypothetical protein
MEAAEKGRIPLAPEGNFHAVVCPRDRRGKRQQKDFRSCPESFIVTGTTASA